ncbi:hypothetical protein BDU57DRAFT_527848 [Ampelomyces quisqualis]|uniref:F-box domain-containing protein n=1 Tax=Ampelomyces quisqualis TaxID=50730 RepID=A0A6A5QWZ0_AMPQU|nr:hypothetical protein BDU57DRAFT_527848 [Ampelomyces quisqualis]
MADTVPLSKVDSASNDNFVKATAEEVKKGHRRASSMAADVYSIEDLEKEKKDISISIETQKLGWKLNESSSRVEDPAVLMLPLCTPKVKKITLHFPLGLEVTARNMKGVTIKDALDAIHKQFKKRADDELDKPYLAGFEWDPEECYTRFVVHQSNQPTSSMSGGGSGGRRLLDERLAPFPDTDLFRGSDTTILDISMRGLGRTRCWHLRSRHGKSERFRWIRRNQLFVSLWASNVGGVVRRWTLIEGPVAGYSSSWLAVPIYTKTTTWKMFSNLQIRPAKPHRRKSSMVARAGVSKRRVSRVLTSASDVPSLDFMEGLFGDEFPEAFSTHPIKSNKSILDLPAELLASISQHLSSLDIKRLRLSSKHLGANVDLLLDRVYISPNRANLNCLQQILGHPRYRFRVSELVWDDAQLEEYSTLEAFRAAIYVDERSTQSGIERLLKDLSRDSVSDSGEYGVFEHDDFFDKDGKLTESAKGILLRNGSQAARDVIAGNAAAMKIQDSYELYQQFYREEREIMKAGLDTAALRHALGVCPNLIRLVLTSEVWRPWNLHPIYHTPFHRSLPSGFRKPTVWPWLGNRPHSTRAQIAHRDRTMESQIVNESDALPIEFRGYSIVISSLISVPNPSISEFIMYTGHETIGVAHQLFTCPNIDYTNSLIMARTIPVRRLVLSINSHGADEIDHPKCMHSGQLRALLDAMPHLEHLDLSPNLIERQRLLDADLSHQLDTSSRLYEIFSATFLQQLKTFALRNVSMLFPDVQLLVQSLTSAQHITLDNVQLSTPNTNHFKLFRALWSFYDFETHNNLSDEMETTQELMIRPIFTVIEPCKDAHKSHMVCEELCEWLYRDELDAESIPFTQFNTNYIKDGIGWVLDDRDERFAVRASEYRIPGLIHYAVDDERGRQFVLGDGDVGDIGDIDGDVDITGLLGAFADSD